MADEWYIDYSADHLSSGTILRTPVGPSGEHPTGVIRYIEDLTNPSLVRTKHITKAEFDDFTRAGIKMPAMYFEAGIHDPLGGYAAGAANARRAWRGAQYLGWSGVILMCCDRWMSDSRYQTITPQMWRDYLNGAKSVIGDLAGGYGFWDAADAAQGVVKHFVQCGSKSVLRPWVNGWQDNNYQPVVGGIKTDRILIKRAFGASTMTSPQQIWDAPVGTRSNGSAVQADDALVNTYLGAFYGGGDAGAIGAFRAANLANSKADTIIAAFNALGAQLSTVFTTIFEELEDIKNAVGAGTSEAARADRVRQLSEDLQALVAAQPAVDEEQAAAEAKAAELPSPPVAKLLSATPDEGEVSE